MRNFKFFILNYFPFLLFALPLSISYLNLTDPFSPSPYLGKYISLPCAGIIPSSSRLGDGVVKTEVE